MSWTLNEVLDYASVTFLGHVHCYGHQTTPSVVVNRTAHIGLPGPIVSGCGYAMPVYGRCANESRHGVHGSFDDGYASRYEPDRYPTQNHGYENHPRLL